MFVLAILVLLTLVVTWPLILHLNSAIIDSHDGLLIAWYLNWDIHGLSDITHFFNANIFYPYHNTLAFSDFMLPQALLVAPIVRVFGEPLLAYNLNFLLGFMLTGFSLYLLAAFITHDEKASILTAILFTFSTSHLSYMAHLQVFNFWPVILTVYFLPKKQYRLYVLFFVIATLTTALFLYFLLTILAAYLFFLYQHNKLQIELKAIFVSTTIAGLIVLPFLLPYFWVSHQFGYSRPITDAIHFSLQFPDLANIGLASRLSTILPPAPDATPAYFGSVFLILLMVMFISIHRSKIVQPKEIWRNKSFWLCIAAVSFILALGPALHIVRNTIHIGPLKGMPLPYFVFYYLVPGFAGFRTPSRWIILTAFSLAMAIAIHFSKKINLALLVLLSLLILLEVAFPFSYYTVPPVKDFPPEQVWLSKNYSGAAIIQFPIYNWSDSGFGQETLREYYSTIHWHPMVNGYSGFSPQEWEDKVFYLQKNFPSPESINYLKTLKIELVLTPASWQERITNFSQLQLVATFPETNIYSLQ